ncbi:MAG: T9SS type B sorting domain-containing protein [Saprospiraceae bacterium]|nr:T9SS type B sorting domain-containing protein [Saprospiraceae bacterium]
MNGLNLKYRRILFIGIGILVFFLNIEAQKLLPPALSSSNSTIAKMPNGCNITVNAGPDITICTGIGKQINGIVTGGYNSITWEPTDGLSNPNIANPIANPAMTTTYTLIARGVSANLFMNGGFETGGIGPSTSGYTAYTNVNSFATSTGGYMVMSVPQIAAQFGCNPPIGAFTMAITPTGSSTNFLCQTITVSPNTLYKIKFKMFGIPYIFGSPPVVNLKINGNTVGTIAVESGLCTQTDADFTWNSGASASANICFSNSGGTGPFAMFSIDDIDVRECCEERDEVKVTVYEVIADIAMPDEINCNNSPLTLDGSGSTSGTLVTYEWTTSNGNIVSGANTNKATVDKPGTYTFKVKGEFGCDKTTSVIVTGNTTPPDANATSTDIDCKNMFAKIEATSKVNPVSFEWSGPNGYGSMRASNNNIREPGDYVVTVTDDYGCKSTRKVTVGDKRTEVYVSIVGDTIKCGQDSIQLKGSSVNQRPEFTWKLRNGMFINKPNIFVKDTGWYYLTVKDSLGCNITDSFKVISYQAGVPITLNGGQLNCKNNNIKILLNADTSGIITWTGPKGFFSNEKNPVVVDSGWYFLSLQTKDGCIGKDSIYISSDVSIPDVTISASDTITCKKPKIDITGSSTSLNAKYSWIGPKGLVGNNNTYSVTDSGDYAFIVETPNGCLNSASLKIYQIQDTPVLNLKNDTLDCLKRSTEIIISDDSTSTFGWTGPNGYSSNQRKVTLDKPGEYQITAFSKNGCPRFGIINIYENLTALNSSISGPQVITCTNKSIQLSANPTSGVNYSWSTGSTQSNITVSAGGRYTVTVTDVNNICTGTAELVVLVDTIEPVPAIDNNGPLTCTKTSVSITALPTTGVTYNWSNSSSLQVSTTSSPGTFTVTVTNTLNGCSSTISSVVLQDITPPNAQASNNGPLTCTDTTVILTSQPATGVTYLWNTGSNTQTIPVNSPGTYTVTITNISNGCTSSAITTVTSDVQQQNALNDGPITCGRRDVTLTAPILANGTYKWSTGASTQTTKVSQPGTYTVTITDGGFCTSIASTIVSIDTTKPSVLVSADDILCNKQAFIKATNISNSVKVSWKGPNGFVSDSITTQITIAGKYYITVTGPNGCEVNDSVVSLQKDVLPDLSIKNDTLNCIRKSLTLFAESTTPNVKFEWTGPNNFNSVLKNPIVTLPGSYTIKITDQNGCELTRKLEILIDTTGPSLDLSADTLTCKRSSVPIKAGTNIQGFNIQWNGPGGFTSMFPQAIVTAAGIYTCTILNPRTQCKTTKTIEVLEDTNKIRSALINVDDAACGLQNGKIEFLSIVGGSPSYQYSIDGGVTYNSNSIIDNLKAGTYSLKIKDINGCEYSQNVNIGSTGGLSITPLPDLELGIGERRQLNLIISNVQNPKILWSPSDQLSCSDCLNPELTATKDQTITVFVTDDSGCRDSISFRVKVSADVHVFIPNSFSPNGDGINDYFYPVSNIDDLVIENMKIFDRWGALMFSSEKFPANQGKFGWNGQFNGTFINPGVYAVAIAYKIGSETKFITGDITVIR